MKKVIFIVAVLFTFLLSSVGYASCDLDTSRWEWVASNDEFGVYYDTQTIKYSNNFAEAWACYYYPYSCKIHPNEGEHYHYILYYFYYGSRTMGMKAYVCRDGGGRVLESDSFSYVKTDPILPESIGEGIAMAVRKRATRRY